MFVRYRTEAIFLKKQKRFEADEYLIAYSRDFGKIGVTGKSIRKIKSKLRSSSELFCYSDIEFVRGRYYNILTDSQLIDSFSKTKSHLGKMSIAFKMANLLDSFLAEEEEDETLWLFVKKSYHFLDNFEDDHVDDLKAFYFYFAFKLLEILGYRPKIGSCVVDGDESGEVFSPRNGGLICNICAEKIEDPLKVKITKNDKIFLKNITNKSLEDFFSGNIQFDNLEDLLSNYVVLLPSRLS